jgi:hypothetical protein
VNALDAAENKGDIIAQVQELVIPVINVTLEKEAIGQ